MILKYFKGESDMPNESYDVIRNECIKVVYLNGEVKYVSIREAFRDAHLIKNVRYSSPVEEYSILRLLIVMAMDCYNYEDVIEIQEALDENKFDMEKFDEYIKFCEKDGPVFDLFDEKKPFLQTRNYLTTSEERKKVKPISVAKIFETVPSGNNHCFYYPLQEARNFSVAYRDILPALAAVSPFATTGGKGYSNGINGIPPYYMLVNTKIENLYQKIVCNCVAVNDGSTNRTCSYNELPPSWRANKVVAKGIEQIETSILDGMTFEARTIKLIPSNGYVKEIYFGSGLKFKTFDIWTDPHVAYTYNKEGVRKAIIPRYDSKIGSTKQVWQDFGLIFSSAEDTSKQNKNGSGLMLPAVFKNVKTTKDDIFLIDVYGIVGCGLSPQQATKRVKMVRERLAFPYEILNNIEKINIFATCVKYVEKIEPLFRRKRFTINSEGKKDESQKNFLLTLDLLGFLDEIKNYLFSDFLNELKNLNCECEQDVLSLYAKFKDKLIKIALKYYDKAEIEASPSIQDMYYIAIDRRIFMHNIKAILYPKEDKKTKSKKQSKKKGVVV